MQNLNNSYMRALSFLFACILLAVGSASAQALSPRAVIDQYCVSCHNEKLKTAGLLLDKGDVEHPGSNAELWEKVVRKLRSGEMPPPGRPRPDAATYRATAAYLENAIDLAAAA